ncbi:MAG TPA: CoA-binding protein [Methylomirabilota bacterium]|nr:CoA-binding protein [Methylomirabilota bacterium]
MSGAGEDALGVGDWRTRLVTSTEEVAGIVRGCRRIAVLGIKTEAQRAKPAFYVPAYLAAHGYDIIPVPVYYPETTAILGRPVYRSLAAVPGPVDMVNVFRRPADIPPHLPDILAARPRVVWLQLGIRHDRAAEALARAGIEVVQDRCLLVEHQRLG